MLLADAAARDGAASRRGSLLFGCASGLLLAPALFLSGVWVRYATPPSQLYGVCYALLALLAAALAARRRQGNRRLYRLSTLGTLVPMFCALGLRWLVNLWDL